MTRSQPVSRFNGPSRTGVCLALAALVFASRAWLIAAWGSPVPFWDQWDADSELYHAWLTNSLEWRGLFAAHNEHRIVLTRLANLALFVVSGGWHPWLQLLLNAVLHAATAGIIGAMLWPALAPRTRVWFVAGLGVIFTATAGWQNALWGFQSQVYFTNLFAVAAFGAFAGLAPGRQWSGRGWFGWCALVLSLFGNASGLLAALVALGLTWPRERTRRAWCAWFAIALVLALGFALRVAAPHHDSLHARSIGQFLAVFTRCLSWPHVDSAWWWIAMQAPLATLCVLRWRARAPLSSAERFAVALAAFAMLQAAAVAYSRGAGLFESRPLSRYQDPLLLGVAAQLFAAVQLAAECGRRVRLALLGWSALALGGLVQLTATNLSLHLPFKRAQDHASLAQVRAYLNTGDASVFSRESPFAGPHPDPAEVIRVLDDPVLRPVLPAAFRDDEAPPWLIRRAPTLTLAALLMLVTAFAVSSRHGSKRPHAPVPAKPGAG